MLFIADTQAQVFKAGTATFAMAIGKHGAIVERRKREGDGKTPLGRYRFEFCYYRADRLARPDTHLHLTLLTPAHGWCDAPGDPRYNAPVRLPYRASHEDLMRMDSLYDVVVVLSHNRQRPVPGYGSAIFLHVAEAAPHGLKPTLGCLALARNDLLHVVTLLRPQSWLIVR
ncbi:MAG: L,D-transpeptidase family protein [Pseudomonadota bacterium]